MLPLSREFLQTALSAEISGFTSQEIKVSAAPSRVYRLSLFYRNGASGVRSAILKSIQPRWPEDPHGPDRELRFYQEVLPRLQVDLPRLYHSAVDPPSGQRLILMEDLAGRCRFPPPTHRWTPDELRCLLRSYARLHVSGSALLPPAGDRQWMYTYHRPVGGVEGYLAMSSRLQARGVWPPLPGLERLVEALRRLQERSAGWPVTLLHHDLYPPNIGLPREAQGGAVLIDWEMGGWGLAELDLAYLDMQPYQSAESLPRREVLAYYWSQRQALEGSLPAPEERQARQACADGLLALAQLQVGDRVARQPFAHGSAPWAYWQAMYPVLHRRLRESILAADGSLR